MTKEEELIGKAAIVIEDARRFISGYKTGKTLLMWQMLRNLDSEIPEWFTLWHDYRKEKTDAKST